MRLLTLSAALLASGLSMAAAPIEGFYSSVFGGATWIFEPIRTFQNGLYWSNGQYNWGYHAGGRFGYQSNPLRYEAEVTYSTAQLKSFDLDTIEQTGVTGNSNATFAMANVYYDFPDMVPALAPFIGIGIGYAYVKNSFYSTGPLFNPLLTQFTSANSAFAYQGTAGFTYNFCENYALNIAYRFTTTTELDNLGKTFQSNFGTVGVIYRFDGNYYQ